MTKASLFEIIKSLNDAGARYLVVGGIAVIAHGYARLTKDVDLMIQLDEANLLTALRALGRLGYQPQIPVTFEQFADPRNRERWIAEKQMKVLKLFSDAHRETGIDVFVYEPIGFAGAYARVHHEPLEKPEPPQILSATYESDDEPADNITVVNVPVCSYEDLVKLKLLASRPQDLADLDQLKMFRGEK